MPERFELFTKVEITSEDLFLIKDSDTFDFFHNKNLDPDNMI
jgi:hypothetical protein